MLFLQGRFLDVSAAGTCRKNPFAFGDRTPHLNQGRAAGRERDNAPRVLCFTEEYVDTLFAHIFPTKPEALFGPQSAVNQDGGHVPEKEWVFGFDRLLTAGSGPNSVQRTLI